MGLRGLLAATVATVGLAGAAQAVPVERLVYKLTDGTTPGIPLAEAETTWLEDGGLNEGVAGADDLVNNGVDFKDSWIDDNWGIIDQVRVSMYFDGVEEAWIDFLPGASRDTFFTKSNVIDSTWGTDVGLPAPAFFFSITGDVSIGRHWFVQNNYGGCGIDEGWMVVLEAGGDPCGWEVTGKAAVGGGLRGFLYSTVAGDHGNQNLASETGYADLFAISVSYDNGIAPIPLPASALFLLGGLGALGAWRRLS